MTNDTLNLLHKKLDGKCEKCGQRCDKRVVSLAANESGIIQMLCPDCQKGQDRPFFKATDSMIDYCYRYTNWEKEQAKQYLETIPLGIALVNCNEYTRIYWNWDRSKYIKTINTDHDGNIKVINYYSKIEINGIRLGDSNYKIKSRQLRKIDSIELKNEYLKSVPSEGEIQHKIDYYKSYGKFKRVVLAIKNNESSEKPISLIDGYSNILAAKRMGLKKLDVWVVERVKSELVTF